MHDNWIADEESITLTEDLSIGSELNIENSAVSQDLTVYHTSIDVVPFDHFIVPLCFSLLTLPEDDPFIFAPRQVEFINNYFKCFKNIILILSQIYLIL